MHAWRDSATAESGVSELCRLLLEGEENTGGHLADISKVQTLPMRMGKIKMKKVNGHEPHRSRRELGEIAEGTVDRSVRSRRFLQDA